MDIISTRYPGLPGERGVYLYGVEIESLNKLAKILKSDGEFTLDAFKKLFSFGPDGYTKQEVEEAFNTQDALKPEEVFSEEFSNVEVRAAIMRYCSPEKIFFALKHKVIDNLSLQKTYPRLKIKGQYGKPDSSQIDKEDIEIENVTRTENYSLIEITDNRIGDFLPWGQRKNPSIIVLKMECPSSKKIYYEYIDRKALTFSKKITTTEDITIRNKVQIMFNIGGTKHIIPSEISISLKNTGEIVRQALAWQMYKRDGEHLTGEEYNKIISET